MRRRSPRLGQTACCTQGLCMTAASGWWVAMTVRSSPSSSVCKHFLFRPPPLRFIPDLRTLQSRLGLKTSGNHQMAQRGRAPRPRQPSPLSHSLGHALGRLLLPSAAVFWSLVVRKCSANWMPFALVRRRVVVVTAFTAPVLGTMCGLTHSAH